MAKPIWEDKPANEVVKLDRIYRMLNEGMVGAPVLDAVLDLLDADGHSWSTRPCQTCSVISGLAGRPFGCIRRAAQPEEESRG